MNKSPAQFVSPWLSKESLLALLLGAVLGQVTALMAQERPGDMFSFAMAVACIVAASASLVTYLLGEPAPGAASAARRAQVPVWLLAIGAGLLIALRVSPW